MILVIAAAEDAQVAAVGRILGDRGEEHHVLDLARFPGSVGIELPYPRAGPARRLVHDGGEVIEPSRCASIWWLRPKPPGVEARLTGPVREFAMRECEHALSGLWAATDVLWVNHPVKHEVASWKAFQLEAAREVGLSIPRTLVTNVPERARAFAASCGSGDPPRAVYKALSGVERAVRTTRWASGDELAGFEAVRLAPVMLQEYVEGVDVRATIVGREIFAVEIDARDTAHPEDWRKDWPAARKTIREVRLPVGVAQPLLDLQDRLGLLYGAADFRRRPDGEHVFLEVNPGGRWLFVEEHTGLPIAAALASLLAGPARRARAR